MSPEARRARYRLFEHYLAKGSVGLAEATLEPFGPPLEGSFNAWARLYERQGRLAEWQDVVERWLAQARRRTDQPREDDRNLEITLLTQLASVYAQQDAWALAEQQLREALGLFDQVQAQRRRERSGTPPAVAAALSSMVTLRRVELIVQHADALRALCRWQEADQRYMAGLDALDRRDASVAELTGRTAAYDSHRAVIQNELRARLLRGRAAVLRELGTFERQPGPLWRHASDRSRKLGRNSDHAGDLISSSAHADAAKRRGHLRSSVPSTQYLVARRLHSGTFVDFRLTAK